MIAALTGELRHVDERHLHLLCGQVLFELLFPAVDFTPLHAAIGEQLTLHTIFYLGGDPTRGGLEPTLIGFLRPADKHFFEIFTTVKGIGPKRALRALIEPAARIAQAIEGRDAKFLVTLPEVGKRTAEQIIAELAGKMQRFAGGPIPAKSAGVSHRPSPEEDAIAGAMSLGLQRIDAERLLDRAKAAVKEPSTDALLREMLRQR